MSLKLETTRHLNEHVLNSNFELLHALEIRQISVIQKLQINFHTQNMILLSKSMIKFEEETYIFVRYNEEFVKSGVR